MIYKNFLKIKFPHVFGMIFTMKNSYNIYIINFNTAAMNININGFEYTKKEVLDALKSRGYLILKNSFPCQNGKGYGNTQPTSTEYALKGNDLPDESTQWHCVASREFQKQLVRPPLV